MCFVWLFVLRNIVFYSCTIVRSFWDRLYEWLKTKNVMPAFDYHIVEFGVFMQNKEIDFRCNNVLISKVLYTQM